GDGLKRFYQSGSLIVSTSRWEGFGLSIIEAMAAGLPVVAFDTSGPRDILNFDEFGIIVPQGDIDSMAENIQKIILDPSLRNYYMNQSKLRAKDYSEKVVIN